KTCAFCNSKLDGDGGPSGLGVGKRLAFDEGKGRLWVICPKCSRWNLTPLDERLERIEALARVAREGRVAAATEQVALIRWHGYDFVRVGKPPRLEFATWRYGERLKARQREQLKIVVPLTVATVGLAVAVNLAAGGSVGVFVWNMPRIARWMYTRIVGRRAVGLIEPPIGERCGTVMRLRARYIAPERRLALEMAVDEHAEVAGLERQWREAEELAEIADGLLSTTAELDAELRRLKQRGPEGGQPSG